MAILTIGIGLAKTPFAVHGAVVGSAAICCKFIQA